MGLISPRSIWSNFDLVVIDASHNFRNNTKGKRDEDGNIVRKSRYERLMDDVIKKGVKTKVLLLSATPVNNDLRDLRNQIYFVTEGRDGAFAPGLAISSIKDTLATAQRTFMEWARCSGERDARDLMDRLSASFFTLLDELTIARSRNHIKKYYRASLDKIGHFPKRRKPESIFSEIDLKGRFMSYDRLNDKISKYELSLFNPSRYVLPRYVAQYEERKIVNFSQANREKFLIGMIKVNFLKRLESSVNSFAITMERTVSKIGALEERLLATGSTQRPLKKRFDQTCLLPRTRTTKSLTQAFQVGAKLKFEMAHLDVDAWLKDLSDRQTATIPAVRPGSGGRPNSGRQASEAKRLIEQRSDPTTAKATANRAAR